MWSHRGEGVSAYGRFDCAERNNNIKILNLTLFEMFGAFFFLET